MTATQYIMWNWGWNWVKEQIQSSLLVAKGMQNGQKGDSGKSSWSRALRDEQELDRQQQVREGWGEERETCKQKENLCRDKR